MLLYLFIGVVVFLLLVLAALTIRVIPNNRVGIVEKRFGLKGSVKSGLIALQGEAGYQPEVLRGGIHLLMPIQYRVHTVRLITIPQGKIGYVFARDGVPLDGGQVQLTGVVYDVERQQVLDLKGTTDADGSWKTTLRVDLSDDRTWAEYYYFEAEVTDASRRPVVEEGSAPVYPAAFDLSLSTDRYGVEVGQPMELLHPLARQVAVGHGVARHRDAQATVAQHAGEVARRLRLAAAGAHRRDGDHRHAGLDLRARRAEQGEVGARRQRLRGEVHDLGVRHVAVGEHHLVDAPFAAERLQLGFIENGNALGVARSGQLRRVAAPGDAGDLRCGEGHHLERRIVAVDEVEVVEIAPGGAEDQDAAAHAYFRR